MKAKRAKVFWTGRSQAVRLPKEFRFAGDTVIVHRKGKRIVLDPVDEWPPDHVRSFTGAPSDLERPRQGEHEAREPLD